MESPFHYSSGFISVVIKHPDQKQRKEGKGLFVLPFEVTAHYRGDVRAGTGAAGHGTATVKSRKKHKNPRCPLLLPASSLYLHSSGPCSPHSASHSGLGAPPSVRRWDNYPKTCSQAHLIWRTLHRDSLPR